MDKMIIFLKAIKSAFINFFKKPLSPSSRDIRIILVTLALCLTLLGSVYIFVTHVENPDMVIVSFASMVGLAFYVIHSFKNKRKEEEHIRFQGITENVYDYMFSVLHSNNSFEGFSRPRELIEIIPDRPYKVKGEGVPVFQIVFSKEKNEALNSSQIAFMKSRLQRLLDIEMKRSPSINLPYSKYNGRLSVICITDILDGHSYAVIELVYICDDKSERYAMSRITNRQASIKKDSLDDEDF